MTVGVYTHVAMTYDGASIKLHLNGALAASTLASGVMETNNARLLIGARNLAEFGEPGATPWSRPRTSTAAHRIRMATR